MTDMGIYDFTGHALAAAFGVLKGAGKVIGGEAAESAKLLGKGIMKGSEVVGRAIPVASEAVGKSLVRPFEKENWQRTRNNWLDLFSDVGGTFVTSNAKGEPKLAAMGLGIIGGVTMMDKAGNDYREQKAKNLGIVDKKPTTATPFYDKVEYEKAPPKRIYSDSGGATGDLVFALHRLR